VQRGVEYEGEDPPEQSSDERMAIKAWNYLADGNDSIDWAGVPFVCEHLGIDDPGALLDRLYVIKTHKPPTKD